MVFLVMFSSVIHSQQKWILTENEFLRLFLSRSYDIKSLKSLNDQAPMRDKKAYAPYNWEFIARASANGSTNSPYEQVASLQAGSVSAGVSKVFETRTILTLEAGASISSTDLLAFGFTMGPPPGVTTYYSNTQSARPYLKAGLVQPVLKNGLWGLPGEALLVIGKNSAALTAVSARLGLENTVLGSLLLYHGMVLNLKLLDINRESLADVRDLFNRYSARLSLGVVSQNDLNRLRSQILQQEIAILRSEKQIAADLDKILSLVLSNAALSEVNFTGDFKAAAFKPGLTESLALAFSNRSDWLQARIIMDNQAQNLRIAENAALPELNATFSLTFKGYTNDAGLSSLVTPVGYSDWFAGVELRFPILAPSEEGKLLEARLEMEKQRADYARKEQLVRLSVTDAYRNVQLRVETLRKLREAEQLSVSLLAQAKRDFDNAKITSRDLVLAEEDWRRARLNTALEEYQLILAYLTLLLETGTLLPFYGIEI